MIVTAQLAQRPLLDDDAVSTDVTIGASAVKPLRFDIPLFVSDMSFGALSEEAKVSLARGAERAGTGICSGEGGMLDEERQENSRYFYELASAKFGWSIDKVRDVQAFHFKFGATWRRRYARCPAASRSVRSCRHSTSRRISTLRSRSASTT